MSANSERDLIDMVLKGAKALAINHAEKTRVEYAADWKSFTDFCAAQWLEPLPAETQTVVLYCHAMLVMGRKTSTLSRHLAAINHYHRVAGHPLPGTRETRCLLTAIKRLRGEQATQKRALSIEDLRRMCESLPKEGPKSWRDRAILTLGYASALRRSSLVALDLADVEFVNQGALLKVRREKQDRKGEGRTVAVMFGTTPTCPVGNLRHWLEWRGSEPGPLFTAAIGGHVQIKRLNAAHVARIVKQAAGAIGLNIDHYAGHSMRAGMITTALELGHSEIVVAAHTGHRSLSVLKKYFRRADPFRGNPSGKIGL